MKILLTGVAGFVGFHAALKLLSEGHGVIGVDNLNDYYDVVLKQARLAELESLNGFEFHQLELADENSLIEFNNKGITHILHLAAQAGVRYSLDKPRSYVKANLAAHLEVLEFARHCDSLEHLAYASSSSVYGEREGGPFAETDIVRSPASLYAATKIGGEMLAESYARLYGIPQTGLRFFTVYGPWGRPDMAYFIFTQKILASEPITLFAPDEMQRDFTYIDDIVAVIPKLLRSPPAQHKLYNLGNNNPNILMDLVRAVEAACERKADLIIKPKQKGDVSQTYADIGQAQLDFGFSPSTSLEDGIGNFVKWYKEFYP